MAFCDECGNLLLPRKKNGKKILYCKLCDAEFDLEGNTLEEEEYKLETNNKHQKRSSTSRVVENAVKKRITEADRESFEEFFVAGQQ